ncbi:MAG: hypothetical protein ACYC0V_02510 [Armatimonadota bacterium]
MPWRAFPTFWQCWFMIVQPEYQLRLFTLISIFSLKGEEEKLLLLPREKCKRNLV